MRKACIVCGEVFKDGDKLAVVMLSEYIALESDVSFATTKPGPHDCLEIFHIGCYDGDGYQQEEPMNEAN